MSQFSFTDQVLTVERDRQLMFTSNCLKRKFEAAGVNGFVSVEDHEICAEQGCYLQNEKRQRFSNNCAVYDHEVHKCTNDYTNDFSNVNNGDNCPSSAHNGNSTGNDPLLQNNLECNTSSECEETVGMDFESEAFDPSCRGSQPSCPPTLNVMSGQTTDECSDTDNSPAKGSPAREFLRKYRPEYQMHCIPSYCHPGGLWDAMLEVYHGL